ncbi:MAG: hypothetical protein ABIG20_05555 [archaeon]
MSSFRYKWMPVSSASIDLKETEDHITFSIPKSAMEHDPIELDQSFEVRRLGKNSLLVQPNTFFPGKGKR